MVPCQAEGATENQGLEWAYVPYTGECFYSSPHIQLAAWQCMHSARRLVPRLYCLYATRVLAYVYGRGPFMHPPLFSQGCLCFEELLCAFAVEQLAQKHAWAVKREFFPQGLPASLGAPRCQHGDVLCLTEYTESSACLTTGRPISAKVWLLKASSSHLEALSCIV